MEKKLISKTTLVAEDTLYEMVYDRTAHQTSFIRCDRAGEIETGIHEVTLDGKTYVPLSPHHALVERDIVLFPTDAESYGSDDALVSEIQAFIHEHVDISPQFEAILPYFVMFTWIYDRFHEVPYIRAIGDYGSGKSRFLQVVGSVCYKPTFTGGATTPSPIFRITDDIRGTLVLDEADFKFSDMTTDIVKILNMGYAKGGSVLRMEGKGTFELRAFDVFGPKIVATREQFSDRALESRFLVENMSAGKIRPDIPRTLNDSFSEKARSIRNRLLMWRFQNFFKPLNQRIEAIEKIHPRLNQIVTPLLSIMSRDDAKTRLKTFVEQYHNDLIDDRGMSTESEIIHAIFKLSGDSGDEILVKDIASEVNSENDLNDTISPRKIGWYLRSRLRLKPHRTRDGYKISISRNQNQLEFWRERLGIEATEAGEHVNDVNVSQDRTLPLADTIRPEDSPF